jgi:adenylate cyclase
MDPNQTQVTELLIRRRRSAILAADVAGYSRLMGTNEEQTLKRLDAARTVMDSRIRQHGGRIANTAGDSVIAEFNNPVDAVRCAVEVQTALRQRNAGQRP